MERSEGLAKLAARYQENARLRNLEEPPPTRIIGEESQSLVPVKEATPPATTHFRIGTLMSDQLLRAPLEIRTALPAMDAHLDKLWFRQHFTEFERRHALSLQAQAEQLPRGSLVDVERERLKRNVLLVGNPGGGKTRFSNYMLLEQLKGKTSAFVLEAMPRAALQALEIGRMAGLTKEQITVIWPGEEGHGIPACNPFDVPPQRALTAANDFVALLKEDAEKENRELGVNVNTVLKAAIVIVSMMGGSPHELLTFFQDPAYRNGLLAEAKNSPHFHLMEKQYNKLVKVYIPTGKLNDPSWYTNKFEDLLENPYIDAMFCGKGDDINFRSLFMEKRLVVAYLDEEVLGENGARFLAGMFARRLFDAAIRLKDSAELPVVFVLDEIETQESFLGKSLNKIATKARQQNLRLLAGCQNIDQMSPKLKRIFSGAAIRVFFRQGDEDAATVGSLLATGTGDQIKTVWLDKKVDKTSKIGIAMGNIAYPLVDVFGKRIKLSYDQWGTYQSGENHNQPPTLTTQALGTVAAKAGVYRVYVDAGIGTPCDLAEFVESHLSGMAFGFNVNEEDRSLYLYIPYPIPEPKVDETETERDRAKRLQKTLLELPVQQAIVRIENGETYHIKTPDMFFPGDEGRGGRLPDLREFLVGGQSEQQIIAIRRERNKRIAELSATAPQPAPPKGKGKAGEQPEKPKLNFGEWDQS